MSGLFGTRAMLNTDVDLLLQVFAFAFFVLGYVYFRKRRFRLHVSLIGFAVVINFFSFLWFMGPVFYRHFSNFFSTHLSNQGVITTWIHVFPGTITLALGSGFFVTWGLQRSSIAMCYRRKRLMQITSLLWCISFLFGVGTYLMFYVV